MIILYAYNIVRNMERTFDTNIRASLSELITRARSVNNQQDIIIDASFTQMNRIIDMTKESMMWRPNRIIFPHN